MGEEYTELCVLSLYFFCKYKIISKLKFYFKTKVCCPHKGAEKQCPGLYSCIHSPSLTSPIFKTEGNLCSLCTPQRGEGYYQQAGRLGWGQQSTFTELEDKMCLQKQAIIIQKPRSICRKSLSHLNLHPVNQRGQSPFDYQTKYF